MSVPSTRWVSLWTRTQSCWTHDRRRRGRRRLGSLGLTLCLGTILGQVRTPKTRPQAPDSSQCYLPNPGRPSGNTGSHGRGGCSLRGAQPAGLCPLPLSAVGASPAGTPLHRGRLSSADARELQESGPRSSPPRALGRSLAPQVDRTGLAPELPGPGLWQPARWLDGQQERSPACLPNLPLTHCAACCASQISRPPQDMLPKTQIRCHQKAGRRPAG